MYDFNTFLTTLYCIVDDFCKSLPEKPKQPGAKPSLTDSEILTLTLLGQWNHFQGESDFYRWANQHLRKDFPTLPVQEQLNRLMRGRQQELVAFFRHTTQLARCSHDLYEVLDSFGVPVRNAKRRGAGWFPLQADKGLCSRLGWYVGFHVLDAVTSEGVITGFGFGSASTKDQTLAETFLAARAQPSPHLLSVGEYTAHPYLADKGFVGRDWHWRCATEYEACVLNAPRVCDPQVWPHWLHELHAHLRQVVESVHEKLLNTFRLARERAHTLGGFCARLTAKNALHNFCIWLNKQSGRHPLEFADLIDW